MRLNAVKWKANYLRGRFSEGAVGYFKTGYWCTDLSIVAGALLFLSSMTSLTSGLVTGPIILLGAIACRSATTRRVKPSKHPTIRIILEALLIGSVWLLWLGQNDIKERIVSDPFSFAVIPALVLLAYVIALARSVKKTNPIADG